MEGRFVQELLEQEWDLDHGSKEEHEKTPQVLHLRSYVVEIEGMKYFTIGTFCPGKRSGHYRMSQNQIII